MAKKSENRTSLADATQLRRDASKGQGLTPDDPLMEVPMKVKVFDITPYKNNPRIKQNPEFVAIKESIRNKGLEQLFKITRRPGDPKYTLPKGGNTRLLCLQELYEETKDPKYLTIDTIFVPWEGETNVLTSHLIENDLRGSLTFLERAKAIKELHSKLEVEREESISTRKLSELLKDFGYSQSHNAIALIFFTIEELYPYIPQVFEEGAGKPIVEQLRKFKNKAKDFWSEMQFEPKLFKDVWERALSECDTEGRFDFDKLEREFCNYTHDETGASISDLKFKFSRYVDEDTLLIGSNQNTSKTSVPEQQEEPVLEPVLDGNSESKVSEIDDTLPFTSDLDESTPENEDDEEESEVELNTYPEKNTDKASSEARNDAVSSDSVNEGEVAQGSDFDPMATPAIDGAEESATLSTLREKSLTLAKTIASSAFVGLSSLVKRVDDGYGWYLMDVPKDTQGTLPVCGVSLEHPDFQKVVATWTQLWTMSGAATPSQRSTLASDIPLDFVDNDATKILTGSSAPKQELVSSMMPVMALQCHPIWTDSDLFSDEEVAMFIELIQVIRHINRLAKAINADVFAGGLGKIEIG